MKINEVKIYDGPHPFVDSIFTSTKTKVMYRWQSGDILGSIKGMILKYSNRYYEINIINKTKVKIQRISRNEVKFYSQFNR